MKTSLFEIFKIGIGPSSSHTVGPMRAAAAFATWLRNGGLLEKTARVEANLYGSLALTGRGHGTDRAVLLGLRGELPDRIATESIEPKLAAIRTAKKLSLAGTHAIAFDEARDLLFHRDKTLPFIRMECGTGIRCGGG
jgi:L-serine dehydratase